MQHLVFDIETIPQTRLSEVQEKKKAEKVEKSDHWKDNPIKEMSLDPWFGRIITIGLFYPERNVYKSFTLENERMLLQQFWEEIYNFDGTFVSYNGLAFDVPFIKIRSMVNNIVGPLNKNFLQTRRFQDFPHFDVAQHASDWDSRNRTSLEMACDQTGISSPKSGNVNADSVHTAYLEGRLSDISEYCEKDLNATYELYNKVRRFRV